MKEMRRNFKYWFITLEKVSLWMLLWVFFIAMIMTVMEGKSLTSDLAGELSSYFVMIMMISIFINAMNGENVYLPLTVSLGSTRKQSFIAMQAIQHLILAQYMLIIGACFYFASKDLFLLMGLCLPTVIGAFLCFLSMGNLIATCCMRFGKTMGTVIYTVLLALLIACAVGFGVQQEMGTLNI